MTLHDLYLLSPELSVAGAAALLILVDLFVRRSGLAATLAIAGLAVADGTAIMESDHANKGSSNRVAFLVRRLSV